MGEIKQTNFRIDQEAADAFRKFCEENGMNQAQGFDHMMQVVELNRAKAVIPGSAKDIENFEMYMKKIMESYLKSVEDYSIARESAREEYVSALESRGRTIADLQEKVEKLIERKKIIERIASSTSEERDRAIKEATAANEQAATASKLVDEKDKTISTLADKLGIAEEKAAGYDDLKKLEEAAQNTVRELQKDLERLEEESDRKMQAVKEEMERDIAALKKDHAAEIRELNAEMERKISDVKKDAALAQAQAVADKEREMNTLMRETDRENARLQVKLEALQSRLEELTASHVKTKELESKY